MPKHIPFDANLYDQIQQLTESNAGLSVHGEELLKKSGFIYSTDNEPINTIRALQEAADKLMKAVPTTYFWEQDAMKPDEKRSPEERAIIDHAFDSLRFGEEMMHENSLTILRLYDIEECVETARELCDTGRKTPKKIQIERALTGAFDDIVDESLLQIATSFQSMKDGTARLLEDDHLDFSENVRALLRDTHALYSEALDYTKNTEITLGASNSLSR